MFKVVQMEYMRTKSEFNVFNLKKISHFINGVSFLCNLHDKKLNRFAKSNTHKALMQIMNLKISMLMGRNVKLIDRRSKIHKIYEV